MEKILKPGELAIIIPVLNCLNYTKQMLPTIKTKHPYKLILINNGSTDGTKEYFDELAKDPDTMVVHFNENRGVALSWNSGIRRAILHFGSRYFFIPNNDTLLHPRCIDILLEAIKVPKFALVSATNVSGIVSTPTDVLGLKTPLVASYKDEPDFSCFMIKRETIERVGYFDSNFYPAYFEDNDYHYRIKLAGLRGVKVNRALYFHYGSRTIKEGEDIRMRSNLGYVANRDYYQRKWGGLPGQEKYTTPFNRK